MKVKQRIYIMGPYSNGDQVLNVRDALRTANDVIHANGVPFIPHLFHFWHLHSPQPKSFWMRIDFQMMHACHAIVSTCELGKATEGMIEEINYNNEHLQLPVFTYKDLMKRKFIFEEVEA